MNRKLIDFLKLPEAFRVPYFGGLLYRMLNRKDNKIIRKTEFSGSVLNQEKRDFTITASLTSFPARIEYVHLAVKSIMRQTCKPDRIILWLAEEQFPDKKLPENLLALQEFGLEIKWCEDLCGHKKYFYCIRDQLPNELVITFDDDMLYRDNCIEQLIAKHEKFPNCIICERAQAVNYDKNGKLKNPGAWNVISDIGIKTPSYSLNISPGGGCLFPYHSLYKDACSEEKVRELAYRADDLWCTFMAAQQGTRIVKTRKYHKIFSVIEGSQKEQLAIGNVINNQYMNTVDILKNAYPLAYNRIITDKD